jgi:hypothetical protein
MRESNYANRHIVRTLRANPEYATRLPGGIHRGIAPPNTVSPFLVFSHVSGQDAITLNSSADEAVAGTGLVYLIKVQDEGNTDGSRASEAAEWVEETLLAANGSTISGAYVTGQRITILSLPVSEGDSITQQEGATFRFWVDRP